MVHEQSEAYIQMMNAMKLNEWVRMVEKQETVCKEDCVALLLIVKNLAASLLLIEACLDKLGLDE